MHAQPLPGEVGRYYIKRRKPGVTWVPTPLLVVPLPSPSNFELFCCSDDEDPRPPAQPSPIAAVSAHSTATSFEITTSSITGDSRIHGKLKWNSYSSTYHLCDDGKNFKKLSVFDDARSALDRGENTSPSSPQARKVLCLISFTHYLADTIRVELPCGERFVSRTQSVCNKKPGSSWWGRGAHSGGGTSCRAISTAVVPSTKNFVLVAVDDKGEVITPEVVVMQFGRASKDTFNIEFRAPLTAFQAFGIALAVFRARGASRRKVVLQAPIEVS